MDEEITQGQTIFVLQRGWLKQPGNVARISAPAATGHANSSEIVNVSLDQAQAQFDGIRHAEPNAALGDRLSQDSKALEKSKADTAEFSPTLVAEKADLAMTEKSLTTVKAFQYM